MTGLLFNQSERVKNVHTFVRLCGWDYNPLRFFLKIGVKEHLITLWACAHVILEKEDERKFLELYEESQSMFQI